MRKVLGNGVRVPQVIPHEEAAEYAAEMWLLGPSNQPQAPFADDHVIEIEVDGRKYHVPASQVRRLLEGIP